MSIWSRLDKVKTENYPPPPLRSSHLSQGDSQLHLLTLSPTFLPCRGGPKGGGVDKTPLTTHRSPLTAHRSPLTTHHSPLIV